MNVLTLIITLIIASNIAVFGLNKFHVSPILTLLVFGLILSNNYFKKAIQPGRSVVDNLGDIGIIAIMFIIGLKMNVDRFEINSRDTYILAFFCFIVPFIAGFLVFKIMGFPTIQCFIIAIVLTVTAEAVNGKLRTKPFPSPLCPRLLPPAHRRWFDHGNGRRIPSTHRPHVPSADFSHHRSDRMAHHEDVISEDKEYVHVVDGRNEPCRPQCSRLAIIR